MSRTDPMYFIRTGAIVVDKVQRDTNCTTIIFKRPENPTPAQAEDFINLVWIDLEGETLEERDDLVPAMRFVQDSDDWEIQIALYSLSRGVLGRWLWFTCNNGDFEDWEDNLRLFNELAA